MRHLKPYINFNNEPGHNSIVRESIYHMSTDIKILSISKLNVINNSNSTSWLRRGAMTKTG